MKQNRDLEILLQEGEYIVSNSPIHHLPLSYRVDLMRKIADISTVNKIFFECVKHVQEIWRKEYPTDNSVSLIISRVDNFLYNKKGEKKDFIELSDKYRNYFEEMDGIAGLIGLGCISLCNSISYDASSILNIDEYNGQDDDSFEWDVWNPDFYASMAYSGGNPFLNEGNISKRMEFWLWYSDMVKAIIQSPDKPLLTLTPSHSIRENSQQIIRTQTYQIESIINKIQTVINNTLNSFNIDYFGINWEKLIINARCMKIGVFVSSSYIKNGESYKIKGNLDSFNLMNDIKYEMYDQAKTEGGWFTCTIEVNPKLAYVIHFNYDDKEKLPEERLKAPDNFKDEFKGFPRSKEYTPLWWQEILGRNAKYLK